MPRLRFLRDNARWLGAGFALFFCASFGQSFFIGLAAPEIRAATGLSHGGYGALYMAATLAAALCLPQLGPLADRWPVRRQALLVLGPLALAALGVAVSTHALLLGLALFALRLFGQGMATHVAFTATGRWFSAQRGQAVALAALGMNAGEALLPAAFVALAAALGWRGAWAAVALLLAVAALPLVCGLAAAERPAESTSPAAAVRSGPARTRAQVLRDPLFPLVLLAVMPPALTGNTVFFHQAQLAAQRAWPPALFAAAFPLMAAATVVCSLAAGRWIDRAGALALLPLYALPMALGCGLLAGVSAPWAVFAFMALYGVSNGASLALFGSLWPQLYGSAHLGAIRSLVAGVLVTVSALGPGLAGLALDAGIALAHIVAGFGFYALAVSLLMAPVSRRLVAQACSRASSARAAVPTR